MTKPNDGRIVVQTVISQELHDTISALKKINGFNIAKFVRKALADEVARQRVDIVEYLKDEDDVLSAKLANLRTEHNSTVDTMRKLVG